MAVKFEELPLRTQGAVLAGLAVVLAGAGFWYLVWPLKGQADALHQQVQALEAQNLRNRAFEQEHAVYQKRLAEAQDQLRLLRAIVPDEPDADGFIRAVRSAEAESGVHIRTFIAQPLVNQELYVEMPYRMRVDGTYYALMGFFGRLARGQRIINVTGLTLGGPEGGGMGPYKVLPGETVGANFIVTTYFNRAPATPPASAPARR